MPNLTLQLKKFYCLINLTILPNVTVFFCSTEHVIMLPERNTECEPLSLFLIGFKHLIFFVIKAKVLEHWESAS